MQLGKGYITPYLTRNKRFTRARKVAQRRLQTTRKYRSDIRRKETSVETVCFSNHLGKGGLDARKKSIRISENQKKQSLVRNASVRRMENPNVGIPIPVSSHEAALVSKCGHGRREVVCTDPV